MIPTIDDLRKHGTRALATYIMNLWSQRIAEVQDESGHLERACLHADLDRWLEHQNTAHDDMRKHNDDMSPKGRVAFWTAREKYDRAQREVDRAWRRLHDPAPVASQPTPQPVPTAKKRNTPDKENK